MAEYLTRGRYFVQQIQAPQTWEELRTVLYSKHLKPLVIYLVEDTHHPAVVNALLALKWHFATVAADDDRGVGRARGLACELVAWRFVTHLTEPDAIDFLCYELPAVSKDGNAQTSNGLDGTEEALPVPETTPLLDGGRAEPDQSFADEDEETTSPDEATSFATFFAGLNALEIAAVADAKKFLCQKSIQRVVDGIWKGDITFWETFGQHSVKQAKVYNERRSDPFCRLRVPLYSKVFEVMFFAAFLAFYYIVLEQKSAHTVTGAEIMLYIWFASFAYNEAVEFWDAGIAFYAIDFWSLWDLGIIATGVAFLVVRIVGMAKNDHELSDIAFDILSVEALFLVPRICSLLSLVPYFGTLIPCLKEMTKDFIKFSSLVAILYVGFDTTFVFLARGTMSAGKINWILIQVFFGSSYLGFGIAEEISPLLGPPLMFVFVCLTNFLLLSTLISLLSNSLTKVIEHAREEYLSVYAIFVLEASTSNRLTYFIPPLNLLPVLLRPLRLVMSAEKLRTLRIVLLKATHWPFVGLILAWERARLYWNQGRKVRPSFGLSKRGPYATRKARRDLSGMSFQQPLLATAPLQPPLDEQAHADRSCSDIPTKQLTAAPETVEALESAVHELRAQVKALASILASEKSKGQPTQ
ncbi:hypothetical protein LTR91_020761 [Friedmanniomyces endolithicus]|uniref:Calcium channel YVC1-like C-terminal transmembrane domain-containing protein n=1 Tax=Friedmanniomyces endolithicus TaxID=329885 RepID=A0AAN6K050_9PEZI|nr:hypothetical protein LTR91_020761 [Friedmanniomyces endolithicus]